MTPIKQNINYNNNLLSKDKPRIKLAGLLNINLNLINNKKKEIYNNNVYKTDNNIENINTFDVDKKNYNIKFKPPPNKRLKIINTELEEINKIKEERKDNNFYKDEFSTKFNNIKNPLIQTNGKSSTNNSQSIPEIITSDIHYRKNENIIKDTKHQKNFQQDFPQKDINNNYHYKNEKEKNLYLKEKYDKDILLLLKPSKLGFKKKLNNLSTLNLNRRPITTFLTHNNIKNNKNKITFNSEEDNNNNQINKNKNLTKIKLKPIVPSKRAITPFIDNIKRSESINIKKKLKYNFSNNKLRSINDNINIVNNDNTSIINNKKNEKKFFMRKLNFDKSKITLGNNLSPIKTKFRNFIKPNIKNFEIIKLKTEI